MFRQKFFMLIFVTAFLFTANIFSQEDSGSDVSLQTAQEKNSFFKNINLCVEPFIQLRVGNQNEYVYAESPYQDEPWLLSELNWNQHAQNMFGLNLGARYKRLKINGEAKASIPSATGYVYDSDWQNYNCATEEYRSYQTNYSISDCYNEFWYNFSLEIQFEIPLTEKFFLSPVIAGEYIHSKYDAISGSYWYGWTIDGSSHTTTGPWYDYSDEEHRSTGTFSGTVITLERIEYFTWLGINFLWNVNKSFSLNAQAQVSPYIHVESLDHHLLRTEENENGIYFLDRMHGFFSGYKLALQLEYSFTKNHAAYFNINGMFTPNVIEGTTYCNSDGNIFALTIGETSGCSYKNINFRIGYRFTIS